VDVLALGAVTKYDGGVRGSLFAAVGGLCLGAFSAAAAGACATDSVEGDPFSNPVGAGGAGAVDGGAGMGGSGGGGTGSTAGSGGAPSPVVVSISANPLVDEGTIAGPADVAEAEIVAYAAGARGAVHSWEWRSSDPDGPGGEIELDAMTAAAQRARDLGRIPMLELLVLDAERDLRPAALAGLAFDDPLVVAALEATLDTALTVYDGELVAIALGRDVSAYLEDHPDDRAPLTALFDSAADFVLAHPAAPPGVSVGVGMRFKDAVSQPSLHKELLLVGSATVLGYVAGLEGSLRDPAFVAADLDAMTALAASRPVVLTPGYPSAPEAGSSEEQQALFYRTLFEALDARRDAFHFVNAFRLYDVPDSACAAEVEELGEDPFGPFAGAWCSLGIRRPDGSAKPVWSDVLAGLATFASP
jgi:hypothetical protein